MPSVPPPPPPPPPGHEPPPPPPPQSAADYAAAALARGNQTFDTAVDRIGRQAAGFGLDTAGDRASVWPVLGVAAMVLALVADRIKHIHTVPVRWMIVLIALGLLVVAGELRRGGRFRALDPLPAWATTIGLRLAMLLVLAAQLTNYLSVGIVQICWWVAVLLVAVPVVRGHQAVRAFRLGSHDVTPEVVGAVAVLAAIVVGFLPKQGDVGTLWSVVAAVAALAVLAARTTTVPYSSIVLNVAAVLVVGIAVVAASLSIVGLLWITAGWLVGSSRWRANAAVADRPPWRSPAGLAMAGCLLAVAAMFGTFDNAQTAGYYSGGYTYQYGYDAYSGESGYDYGYDAFAYYNPGFFFETSGRGKPVAPLEVAGLVALAGFARRRGQGDRLVRFGAAAVAVGTLLWVAFTGSYAHVPVWVAAAGTILAVVWAGRAALQVSRTPPAPAPATERAPA